MRRAFPAATSLAGRLFITAALACLGILLVAGVVLSRPASTLRGTGLRRPPRHLSQGSSGGCGHHRRRREERAGRPRRASFQAARFGWYWQITTLGPDGTEAVEIKTSKSLFAGRLPIETDIGGSKPLLGARQAVATGTDDRVLRMVEGYIEDDNGRYLVAVAGDPAEITREVRKFSLALVVTFSVLATALLISTWVQVRFGLRPLGALSRQLAAIRQGEAERIEGQYPTEIAPLAAELNELVGANREIVERARTQVGNLAHALKTPLSVIRNEADAANGSGVPPEKVREQAGLMQGQIQYYLDRARAATRAVAIGSATEVEPVLERLVRTFGKIHAGDGIGYESAVAPGLVFRGERQDLEDMLGNLMDNAGKWAGVAVKVDAHPVAVADGGRPMMEFTVADDGPGLPEAARAEALRRGKRLDETKPGSGLGLHIVLDLATLYGGALSLEDNEGGGLLARLKLPAIERVGTV